MAGKQIRTGSLGDVMQESIQARCSGSSRAIALGIDPNFMKKRICIFMYLREQHQKMDQVRGSVCVLL